MIIELRDLMVCPVEAGNPYGYEPGVYVIHRPTSRLLERFDTMGEYCDYIDAHKVKEDAA